MTQPLALGSRFLKVEARPELWTLNTSSSAVAVVVDQAHTTQEEAAVAVS
jgi:hypothetical protein